MYKITIIPNHPSDGYASMMRHWQVSITYQCCEPNIHSILPVEDSVFSAGRGRFYRAFQRYFAYPRLIANSKLGELAHILDHSSAHLLKAIPPHVKKVVTVHDLIPLASAEGLSSRQVARFARVVENLKLADYLISDSGCTKSEIIRLLGIPEKKIEVIPMGVEASWLKYGEREEVRAEVPTILSLGNTLHRKNLQILPMTLRLLKEKIGRVRLIRAGQMCDPELSGELRDILGEDFIEEGFVSEERLVSLYQESWCVFFPSFYEGFGLPVLEAMAIGTPVVCSNRTSIPEVGGDAVIYFSPDNPEEAARSVEILCSDEFLRNDLRKKGLERAKAFTWEAHFEKVSMVYKKILGK